MNVHWCLQLLSRIIFLLLLLFFILNFQFPTHNDVLQYTILSGVSRQLFIKSTLTYRTKYTTVCRKQRNSEGQQIHLHSSTQHRSINVVFHLVASQPLHPDIKIGEMNSENKTSNSRPHDMMLGHAYLQPSYRRKFLISSGDISYISFLITVWSTCAYMQICHCIKYMFESSKVFVHAAIALSPGKERFVPNG
jgi:hypothetical protein